MVQQSDDVSDEPTFASLRAFALASGIADVDLPRMPPPPARRVMLDGAYNFRDVGGLRTIDGRVVRRGRLFRSDHLHGLSDRDVEVLSHIGLGRVLDFRLDSEVARQPSRLPAGLHPSVRLATADGGGLDVTMMDVVADMLAGRRDLPERTFWDDNYVDMLDGARPMFVRFAALIADGEHDTPDLFHCTGGKDRTGLAAALLLDLVGVDADAIVDDFLLTNLYRTPHRAAALREGFLAAGVDVARALPILGVTRSAIETARSAVSARYGGTERYLVGGGLDPEAPARLRSLLLTSA